MIVFVFFIPIVIMDFTASVSNCHPNAKPFCCPICDFDSKYAQNLHRHVRHKHSVYYWSTYVHTLKNKHRLKKPPRIQSGNNESIVSPPSSINYSQPPPPPPPPSPPINYPTPPIDDFITPPPVNEQTKTDYINNKTSEKRKFADILPETSADPIEAKKPKSGIIIEAGQTSTNLPKDPIDVRLIPSFKLVIYGPSRSGKTLFVKDLLLNLDAFTVKPPKKTIIIYTVWQPAYDEMKNEGLVDTFIQDNSNLQSQLSEYIEGKENLFIFDDMVNSKNIDYISELFMVQGRHNNISLVFISQQAFRQNEAFKSISNNTNYLVLMKNDRNILEVQSLAKQMTPGPQPLLLQIFREATNNSYSYLFINFTHERSRYGKYLNELFDVDYHLKTYIPT